jgi:tetratricopeptide (TPR) repeat protein
MRCASRLLLPLLLTACEPSPPAATATAGDEHALAQARDLLAVSAKADPPKALELLLAAYGPSPKSAEAALLLARAAFRSGQPDRCTTALDAYFVAPAADHVEWTAEAWVLRGWLLERDGRFAEALPHYAKALEAVPNYAWALFRTGNALSESGDAAGALAWVDRALTERPALLEAHFLRAQLLRRLDRAEEAERATQLHRLLNQASDNTATTREAMQVKYAALEQLETLLPQWIDGRLTLARLRAKVGLKSLAAERAAALLREGRPLTPEQRAELQQLVEAGKAQ